MHLPSAGMIRFRFNGSAFASQPYGHPEVGVNIRAGVAGARGIVGTGFGRRTGGFTPPDPRGIFENR